MMIIFPLPAYENYKTQSMPRLYLSKLTMLSQKAKYALQALSYLAEHYHNSEPVFIRKISRDRNIPIKFLQTILCELKKNQILTSLRGCKGGYRLSVDPARLTVASIIRGVDGPITFLNCVNTNSNKRCDNCNERNCGISHVMAEARQATISVLEKRTLKDIVNAQQLAAG
jgi:Rrf2 family protein